MNLQANKCQECKYLQCAKRARTMECPCQPFVCLCVCVFVCWILVLILYYRFLGTSYSEKCERACFLFDFVFVFSRHTMDWIFAAMIERCAVVVGSCHRRVVIQYGYIFGRVAKLSLVFSFVFGFFIWFGLCVDFCKFFVLNLNAK